MDTVLYEVTDRVATVTLNRPDRLNAFTPAMGTAFNAALRRADADPEVVTVVVTGAGRGFCGGADLSYLESIDGSGEQAPEEGLRPSLLMELRKPVIAAVNGSAAGVGLVLCLYADVRFVAEEAKLTTTFARLGLVAEYGSTWLLPRLVGVANAADLLLSSRTITGREAGAMGLAQHVLPAAEVLPAAHRYAADVAAWCAPRSLATIKEQLTADLHRELPAALADADARMAASFASPDLPEAMRARSERRPPRFRGLDT